MCEYCKHERCSFNDEPCKSCGDEEAYDGFEPSLKIMKQLIDLLNKQS